MREMIDAERSVLAGRCSAWRQTWEDGDIDGATAISEEILLQVTHMWEKGNVDSSDILAEMTAWLTR